MTNDIPELFTIAEVAAACRVAEHTVRGWKRRGLLRVVKLPGGSLRVTRHELERILEDVMRGSDQEDIAC